MKDSSSITRKATTQTLTIEQFGCGIGEFKRATHEESEKFHADYKRAKPEAQETQRKQFVRGWLVGNLRITADKADFYCFELTRAQRKLIKVTVKGAESNADKAYDCARGAFRDNVSAPKWLARAEGKGKTRNATATSLVVPDDVQALADRLIALCATYDCSQASLIDTAIANAKAGK